MHRLFLAGLALALCLSGPPARSAGFQFLDVPADAAGPAIHGAMWYPCAEPAGTVDLGNMTLPAVKDCPISGDELPLVVVSHGEGGSFVGHHDTDETLADAGFVVAAISHPGDNASDLSRNTDLSVFIERPTDIKRLIDFMLGPSPVSSRIDRRRVGLFGFSRGGYTALVVIGANVDWAHVTQICQGSSVPACAQVLRKEYPSEPLTHDPRIRAAVIADPLAILFTAGSLAAITTPIQLWASERGGDGIYPRDVAEVDKSLPASHEFHVVPNSGHFVFLAPCSPAGVKEHPELCTDASDFDRVAFHKQFDAAVLAFFRANLGF